MSESETSQENLLFIEEARLPPPLDPHIASVALGSPDNSADGGYDLFMSAVIGCDQLTLFADEEPLGVEISVNQAEVRLDFINCSANWGRDHESLFRDDKTSTTFQDTSETSIGGSANVIAGNVSADVKKNESRITGGAKAEVEFIHSPLELVRIGNWRRKIEKTLHPVQRYFGWRVEHNDGALSSGVLARIRVKKNWLDIKEVEASENSGLADAIRAYMMKNVASSSKANLFNKLVKELIFLRLQKSEAEGYATLAASGVIVRQGQEVSVAISSEAQQKISIPTNLLLRFLTSKEGSETDTYNEILLSETEKKRIDLKQFVPQASYTETLSAFCELAAIYRENSKIDDYDAIREQYSPNVMQELSSLGLVRRRKNAYHFINPFPKMDYIMAFESVVRSQPTISKTIEVLSQNPEISNLELGNELNKFLNRNWKETSKKRSGMQLKNWARFRGVATKKRQYAIPDDALPLLLSMDKQGKTHIEIAKHFNVVPATVSRRLKSLRDKDITF